MVSTSGFGLATEDDNIWPKRLLRIKDWTSYEVRHEGDDVYYAAAEKNPRYAILSYTWGRYRADGGFGSSVLPEAEAIDIRGVDWDIPKIDPNKGFGRHAFRNAIEAACQDLDYIWLDVACINQRIDTDDQIGCQAAIFHRASKASIWLHQQKQENGNIITDTLAAMIHDITSPNRGVGTLRTELVVNQFLGDPWFSSLWTLQESFLRKDAVILAHNGEETLINWKDSEVRLDLHILLDICTAYLDLDGPPGNFHILQPIKNAGLDTMVATNPLVLLRAARHRTTTKMNDRVLGIQQIFGVDVKQFIDLSQLEVERALSTAINVKSPSISQAFLHPYDSSRGGARWQVRLGTFVEPRVYSSDQAPASGRRLPHRNTRRGRHTGIAAGIEDTLYIPPDFHHSFEIESPHRATVRSDSDGCLQWSGWLFRLEELWASWKDSERARYPPGLEQGTARGPSGSPDLNDPYMNSFDCSMYLDDVTWVSTPRHTVQTVPVTFSRYGWPLLMVHQLCLSRPAEVEVLILGKIRSQSPGPKREAWIGLLVKSGRGELFDRIGFCTWREDIGPSSDIQTRLLS